MRKALDAEGEGKNDYGIFDLVVVYGCFIYKVCEYRSKMWFLCFVLVIEVGFFNIKRKLLMGILIF